MYMNKYFMEVRLYQSLINSMEGKLIIEIFILHYSTTCINFMTRTEGIARYYLFTTAFYSFLLTIKLGYCEPT